MSTVTLSTKKLAVDNVMLCPLCGMAQEGFVSGIRITDGVVNLVDGKWYAFCNCKNIFFTSWENMKQGVYDKKYQDKYNTGFINPVIIKFQKEMFDKAKQGCGGAFLEVGVVNDNILDMAKEAGYSPVAVDINKETVTKYPLITTALDDAELPKASFVWLSHVLEHTRNPVSVMQQIYKTLNSSGRVYVAMPDPWFIPWENPYLWAHWHVDEHHIMWDMDSFIDACENIGFSLVHSQRRAWGADFHVILEK